MTMTLDEIRKALEDSDDLVEAIRTDDVIMLAQSEGERLILVKHDALAAAIETIDELEESFELYDGAMRRGTKMWQDATGNTRIHPDGAKLISWLMEKLEGYETIIARIADSGSRCGPGNDRCSPSGFCTNHQ